MENTEDILSVDESILQFEKTSEIEVDTIIIDDNTEEQFQTQVLYELRTANNLLGQQYVLSLYQTGVIAAVFVLLVLYKFINSFFNKY